MPPMNPNEEERREELAEDNGTPFQAADTLQQSDTIGDTHPVTDVPPDSHELYDEGVDGATETVDQSQRQ